MNLVGTRIGSYVVDRELGSGGTGTVYACKHTLIEREVAVKVLHDEHARDPDQVARFFQEAKAAADIGHPNIIVIIDYGSLDTPSGHRTYVMMESLEGESLDKRLRRGGLSLDDIRHVLTQVASALVACHGKGIVHRDLKPSNVFLCRRSFDPMFVKVLDFGTAKLAAPTPGLRKTQLGVVIGTPAYMSPEQCEGKGAIDHRSDIYSLGVMLYEMLTGALPYDGGIGDILIGHLHRVPVPPRDRNPSIPPEWEALCLRMMEKSREARFQSVTQLAHALEDLRGHAASYEEARARRDGQSRSGRTLVTTAPDAPPGALSNENRPTLHVDVGAAARPAAAAVPTPPPFAAVPTPPPFAAVPTPPPFAAVPTPPPLPVPTTLPGTPMPTQPPVGAPAVAPGPSTLSVKSYFDPRGPCAALVTEPRNESFSRALMLRHPGVWFELAEVCHTAQVTPPAALASDLAMFVTWVEHPYPDPSLAAVIFLSLRSGWSTVVLCPRVR